MNINNIAHLVTDVTHFLKLLKLSYTANSVLIICNTLNIYISVTSVTKSQDPFITNEFGGYRCLKIICNHL
jgi:hypothetical protein